MDAYRERGFSGTDLVQGHLRLSDIVGNLLACRTGTRRRTHPAISHDSSTQSISPPGPAMRPSSESVAFTSTIPIGTSLGQDRLILAGSGMGGRVQPGREADRTPACGSGRPRHFFVPRSGAG